MVVLSNPRHERFAQELASGKTAREAYELAGYKPHDGNASILRSNQKVIDRLTELQQNVASKIETTTETLVAELEEARSLARETKQPSAMAQATIGKARLLGLIVEKKEDVTPRRSLSELDARIRQLTRREREGGAVGTVGRAGAKASRDKAIPNVSGQGTA